MYELQVILAQGAGVQSPLLQAPDTLLVTTDDNLGAFMELITFLFVNADGKKDLLELYLDGKNQHSSHPWNHKNHPCTVLHSTLSKLLVLPQALTQKQGNEHLCIHIFYSLWCSFLVH